MSWGWVCIAPSGAPLGVAVCGVHRSVIAHCSPGAQGLKQLKRKAFRVRDFGGLRGTGVSEAWDFVRELCDPCDEYQGPAACSLSLQKRAP